MDQNTDQNIDEKKKALENVKDTQEILLLYMKTNDREIKEINDQLEDLIDPK